MAKKIDIGEKAPNFSLPDAEKRTRTLKEFIGQKVILVFYVKAFIATCTKEVCEFRDAMRNLINLKAQIVGIDPNEPIAINAFAKQNRLQFPILSDSNHKVTRSYGISGPSILILDEEGIVNYMWTFDDAATEPNYKEIEEMLEYITPKAQIAKGAHDVITISRQIGSGGDEIARKVCKILGFAYFDKNLMYDTAKKIGICEGDITDFSEDSYKITSLVDKILGRKRLVSVASMLKDNASIVKILDEEKCLDVVQTVINSLCGRGKIVIVGRGGQAILKNKLHVLHVRIVAPLDVRVERIMREEGVTQEEALRIITENDKAASEYLLRFYNIDWNDPTNYSMVLNTGKMDLDTAIKGIVLACKYGH